MSQKRFLLPKLTYFIALDLNSDWENTVKKKILNLQFKDIMLNITSRISSFIAEQLLPVLSSE